MLNLSIPFFNKQNYVVLKCYTYNKLFLDTCPITIGSKAVCPSQNKIEKNKTSFRTCYSRIATLKNSATVLMPSDISFSVEKDKGIKHRIADENFTKIEYTHTEDSAYGYKDGFVTKISLPWSLEETTGVHFITARHASNHSRMMLPSGMLSYKLKHNLNFFNLVPNENLEYTVKHGTPILSLYSQSEKRLYVESYYDPIKFEELYTKSITSLSFMSTGLKLNKMGF